LKIEKEESKVDETVSSEGVDLVEKDYEEFFPMKPSVVAGGEVVL